MATGYGELPEPKLLDVPRWFARRSWLVNVKASLALPDQGNDRPPVVLVHGAANSARVWTFWQRELAARGWSAYAIDLRGHGDSDTIDLSHTSMRDYAEDVSLLVSQLKRPPVLVGWSMGGLVAAMVASEGTASACVLLEPSPPTRQCDESVELRTGEFGAEEYGIVSHDLDDQPTMPDLDREERRIALASLGRESRLARDERRRRGVVVKTVRCPLLVVQGALDGENTSPSHDDVWPGADYLTVEGASHWGLALNRRALVRAIPAVLRWIESTGRVGPSAV